jgi:phosphoheptose isomerase
MSAILNEHIEGSIAALERVRELADEFERACDVMAEALRAGKKILACGNGGSAADSGHFTTELLCRFIQDRPSLPAISLAQDGGFLTATGNDYGFARIFSRQVEGLGQEGDVLVAFTTSGQSENVRLALETARAKGLKTIALLGRDGGVCKDCADIVLTVPIHATARIQEAHKVLLHAFCAGLERRLFGL